MDRIREALLKTFPKLTPQEAEAFSEVIRKKIEQKHAEREFSVGSTLKSWREQAGIMQKEAAAQLHWSPSKVLRIENGQVNVSWAGLGALIKLYGIHEATAALLNEAVDAQIVAASSSP